MFRSVADSRPAPSLMPAPLRPSARKSNRICRDSPSRRSTTAVGPRGQLALRSLWAWRDAVEPGLAEIAEPADLLGHRHRQRLREHNPAFLRRRSSGRGRRSAASPGTRSSAAGPADRAALALFDGGGDHHQPTDRDVADHDIVPGCRRNRRCWAARSGPAAARASRTRRRSRPIFSIRSAPIGLPNWTPKVPSRAQRTIPAISGKFCVTTATCWPTLTTASGRRRSSRRWKDRRSGNHARRSAAAADPPTSVSWRGAARRSRRSSDSGDAAGGRRDRHDGDVRGNIGGFRRSRAGEGAHEIGQPRHLSRHRIRRESLPASCRPQVQSRASFLSSRCFYDRK